MRLKKFAAWMLLAVMAALPLCARAEAELSGNHAVEGLTGLHPVNGSYAARLDGGDTFAVFSPGGDQLSAAYRQIDVRSDMPYYMVTTQQNTHGLVDGSGQEVVPAIYDDVRFINDHWSLGLMLENWSVVVSTDVYFDGQMIGTLDAEDFTISSYCVAHGAYLGIGGGQAPFYLSSRFERVPSMLDYLSDEYFYDWNTGAIHHLGSGQKAFDPACTLTADEVERAVWYQDGSFVGLQGQVLASGKSYNNVEYQGGDYLLLRTNEGTGVADMQGTEVLPPIYSQLGGKTTDYFAMGYQAVLKDGMLSWVGLDGSVTAAVERTVNEGDLQGFGVNGLFAAYREQGETVVFTATAGELPQRYEEAVPVTSPRQRLLCVRLGGQWGAIDTEGRTVIPFEHAEQLQISQDGAAVLGQNAQGQSVIYAVSFGDEPAATAKPAATPEPAPAQTVDDGWICPDCGLLNTLNFCPNDGTARPVEPPACQSCGYVMPDGSTPNFCPNCGAAFQ